MSDSLLLDFVCQQVVGISSIEVEGGVKTSVEWNDEYKGQVIYGIGEGTAKTDLASGRAAIKSARAKWQRECKKIDAKQ